MSIVFADRVRETCTSPGTGTITLLGAATGYQTFSSAIGNANTCYYTISDQSGSNWEVGLGTYASSGNTLARNIVLSSSNAGSKVNFSSGTQNVYVTYPAETAVWGGQSLPSVLPTLNLDFVNSRTIDPRITFTRATTATYYNGVTSALAEQNLLTYSQTFSNAAWVASNATVGAVTTAPDGTSTAYPLTASAGNGTLLQTFTATANAYTFSIYIQRVTGTGNIDITVDGVTYSTQTTTGTWTRFSVTTTPAAGTKTAGIKLATSGDAVNIWGAQIEQRSTATAYTATTSSAITNYIPQLMTAASGVPRLDYDPVTRVPKGLLIEEQRTNLLTYSSQFNNAVWGGSNTTRTANTIVSPDGTIDAYTITASNISYGCLFRGSYAYTASTTYTLSVYVKAGTANRLGLRVSGNCAASGDFYPWFDLTTGVFTTVTPTAGTIVNGSSTSIGNGWWRLSVVYTTPSVAPTSVTDFAIVNSSGGTNYVPAGTETVYLWGAQLEAGAFATSYIPTTSAQVTRNPDQASMTGTNFSSWYNQGQGTVYAECDIYTGVNSGSGNYYWSASDGTISNMMSLAEVYANNSTTSQIFSGGSVNFVQAITPIPITAFKSALAYNTNDCALSVSGSSPTTDTTVTVPSVNNIKFGLRGDSVANTYLNGHIRNLKYYPVRLSNATLQGLTS